MGALVNRPLLPGSNPFPEASHLTKANDTMLGLLGAKHITSFVIDAEVVALDKDTGAFRTFQDLSNRAKKDVRVEDIKVIVGVFSFDLMLLNDEVSLSRVRGTLI
jgi:DNA ligase-1